MVSIVLGVIIGATGLGTQLGSTPAGDIVSHAFEFIAAPTAVVILFVVGYELQFSRSGLGAALVAVVSRFAVMALLGHTLALSRIGWRILTWRWAFFFVFLAGLNEVIWRNFSEAFWVSFKAWGMFPITLLFALSQVPLIQRHAPEAPQQG
jgi:intracellular septation protein A